MSCAILKYVIRRLGNVQCIAVLSLSRASAQRATRRVGTVQCMATRSSAPLGRSNNVAQNDGTSLYYPSYFCGASSGPKYFYSYKSCGWFFQPDGYWAQGSWNGDTFSPKCARACRGRSACT